MVQRLLVGIEFFHLFHLFLAGVIGGPQEVKWNIYSIFKELLWIYVYETLF